jgi:hypothetical protein
MSVRVKTSAKVAAVAFVDTGDGETRVRFRRTDHGNQWRCDACGSQKFATCPHARQALTAVREALTERTTR